jgi:hypothetical protein
MLEAGPGLWLPHDPSQANAQGTSRQSVHMGITLGYRSVYDKEATWGSLFEALDGYSIESVVAHCSRIGILLHKQKSSFDPETQKVVCDGVFGPESNRVFEAALELEREVQQGEGSGKVVIFSDAQVLNLIKAALLCKSMDDPNDSEELAPLGRALLMITDLCEGLPGDISGLDETDPRFRERWVQYIIGNLLFHTHDVGPHGFARSFDLYLTDHPSLRASRNYVDLPRVIESITGLENTSAWASLFAIASHYTSIDANDPESVLWLNVDRTFNSRHEFSDSELRSIRNMCDLPAEILQDRIREDYSSEDLRPFHILPFEKSPLITFDTRTYCPSPKLMLEKLCGGVFHHLLHPMLDEQFRERILAFLGDAFCDYVHRLFERAFPPASGRYLRLDEVPGLAETERCDGVLNYGDAVILLEVKTAAFSLRARTGESAQAIYSRFEKVVVKAARQLESSASLLMQGRFHEFGIDPTQCKVIFPVIVTLEESVTNELVHAELERMLDRAGVSLDAPCSPLQVIDIGELERLEMLAEQESLAEMISEKVADRASAVEPLTNFLHRTRPESLKGSNPALQEIFREAGDAAKSFFQSRELEH